MYLLTFIIFETERRDYNLAVFFKNSLSTNKFSLYANVNCAKMKLTKSIMTRNNRKSIVITNFVINLYLFS